jgi:hypothetical protein
LTPRKERAYHPHRTIKEAPLLPPPEQTGARERTIAVLAWLWLLLALPFLTDAACNMIAAMGLFMAWALLACAWLLIGLAGPAKAWTGKGWWIAAGVAGCLGVGLALTDAGLRVRVAVSRSWLDAYAEQVPADTRDRLHEPRWVGLFRVDGTESIDGTVFLYTSSSYLNRHGIVFVPPEQGAPQISRRRINGRLHGPWHSFTWKF